MSRKAFAASDAEWCYHDGEFVRLGDVRLSPATHALNYGTGVFEGIRAYWSGGRSTMQVLKIREHYERFEKSCRMLRVELPHTVDELCEITLEILRRNAPRQDTYIRPLAYKAAESVGVALAVDEAQRAGFDDAIFLTQDGHVSEASAANIFLLRKGGLVTPPVTADILEGITRDAVMELALQELYFEAARGDNPDYGHWTVAVEVAERAAG